MSAKGASAIVLASLVVGMLVTGSLNTLSKKAGYDTCSEGLSSAAGPFPDSAYESCPLVSRRRRRRRRCCCSRVVLLIHVCFLSLYLSPFLSLSLPFPPGARWTAGEEVSQTLEPEHCHVLWRVYVLTALLVQQVLRRLSPC